MIREEWGSDSQLLSLVPDHADDTLPSSTMDRLRFGAAIAIREMAGRVPWILYNHLAVAQVQSYVPRQFEKPYGVFLHGIEVWRPLTQTQYRVLNNARVRIANSSYTAQRIAELHPQLNPVVACPLALPPMSAGTGYADAVGGGASPTVVTVARMLASERYKGHDVLLEAWPAVVRQHRDARLVFVGEGDDVPRLKGKATTLGIGASVRFPGFLDEDALRREYSQAAVFAMPSRAEGFGLAYLEAMSHGLPCIGSIHDAAREIIEDGVTGFLVDQARPDVLAARLTELLSDDRRRRSMGEQGRARVNAHFTYQQFARRLIDLINGSLVRTPMAAPSTRSR